MPHSTKKNLGVQHLKKKIITLHFMSIRWRYKWMPPSTERSGCVTSKKEIMYIDLMLIAGRYKKSCHRQWKDLDVHATSKNKEIM